MVPPEHRSDDTSTPDGSAGDAGGNDDPTQVKDATGDDPSGTAADDPRRTAADDPRDSPAGTGTDPAFFGALVANATDAVLSVDREGRIVYANRAAGELFGDDPGDLEGDPATAMLSEAFGDALDDAVARYQAAGTRRFDWSDEEFLATTRDGTQVSVSVTLTAHGGNGDPVFSAILRDVTGRVQRQRELERQNEQLERFASVVSHDIRSPLQSASANLTLLQAEYDDELLDDIGHLLEQIDDLVGDVLTLAKQGQAIGDTRPVSLEAMVENAWDTLETASGELVFDGEVGLLEADGDRLEELLANLLGNALDHGVPGGSDGGATERPAVTVHVGPLDGGFYVADDGPGFETDETDSLFEYGFTTGDEGTGLGLNIVQSIAEAHGWEVAASDSEYGGARFEITGVDRMGGT